MAICCEKMQTCGACNTRFSQRPFAERLSERYELTDDCKNKAAGCKEIIKCSLMKAHIKDCDYRPIECNADRNKKDCYGKLFELKLYMKHAIEVHKCRTFSNGQSCGFIFSIEKGDDVKSLDGNIMASNFRCKTAILKYNRIAEKFDEEFSSWSLPLIPLNHCLDKEETLKSGKIGSIHYTAVQHVAKIKESQEATNYVFFMKVDITKIDNNAKELPNKT